MAYRIHRDSDWRCGDCVRILQKFCRDFACGPIRSDRSITSILASNNILRKRNVALTAAYATLDKCFKEYRGNVVERFGEQVDRELR